jgi:hypothetical protein
VVGQADAGTTADSSQLKATHHGVPVAQQVMPRCRHQSLTAILTDRSPHTHSCINACGSWLMGHYQYSIRSQRLAGKDFLHYRLKAGNGTTGTGTGLTFTSVARNQQAGRTSHTGAAE